MKISLNRFPGKIILSALLGVSLSSVGLAEDGLRPNVSVQGDIPVTLSWQEWTAGPGGLIFSTQARRKESDKLPANAHLHVTALTGSTVLQTQAIGLPVRTLNQVSTHLFHRSQHRTPQFTRIPADLQIPVPTGTDSLNIRYCTEDHRG
jgi:hypothetical protein